MRKRNQPLSIGFTGLGRIGLEMVSRLLAAGHTVRVLGHRRRAPVEAALALGATEAASLASLGQECSIVFLSLPGSDEVESVVAGSGGLAQCGRAGLIVVDTSTSLPASTRSINRLLMGSGMAFVDAPIVRTPAGDDETGFISLVGATEDTFEVVAPYLATWSDRLIHLGPSGAGHTARLINSIVTCGQAALLTEALGAAAKNRVDLASMIEILRNGYGHSGTLERLVPAVLEQRADAHPSPIGSARKDVRYFRAMADMVGLTTPVSDAVHQVYGQAAHPDADEPLLSALLGFQCRVSGVSFTRASAAERKAS
ncbi:MAG: NAD(P)-dependent oxidoreductase [Pseudomonadota bacterium]